jgi:hypothetical protein
VRDKMMSEEVPPWVKELTSDNFLAVYDVGLDIRQELQLKKISNSFVAVSNKI